MKHLTFLSLQLAKQCPRTNLLSISRICLITSALSLASLSNATPPLAFTAEPGSEGSSFSYATFPFIGVLGGTLMDGQTEWVDILFAEDKVAVAGRFKIGLAINQDDEMGVWPTDFSQVIGYLLDSTGDPLPEPLDFAHTGTMPTQVWPGWGYYLPNGTEYLPGTTIYESNLPGSVIDPQPDGSYYLKPMTFSGIRFGITLPDTPDISVLGLRVTLSNYADYHEGTWINPIHVSPEAVPVFFVPEPTTLSFLGLGALAMVLGRRMRR